MSRSTVASWPPRRCCEIAARRAVVERLDLHLVEQQRALDRVVPRRRRRAPGRRRPVAAEPARRRRRCSSASRLSGSKRFPVRVLDLERRRRSGASPSRSRSHAHEDREPDLVAGRAPRLRGAAQEGGVLDVRRVEDAGELDLVGQPVDVDVDALRLGDDRLALLSLLPQPASASAASAVRASRRRRAARGMPERQSKPADGRARAAVAVLLEDAPQPPQRLARAALEPAPASAQRLHEPVGRQRRLGLERAFQPRAPARRGLERPLVERLDPVVLARRGRRRRSGTGGWTSAKFRS